MEKQDVSSTSTTPESSLAPENNDDKKTTGYGGFVRVFKYGEPVDYVLEFIGILAAIGSGVALTMMNLIIGNMSNDFTAATANPDKFMASVSQNALYFVYIGIARFATTYIYSSLFTYVAFKLTRNVRRCYLQAALSQEISFFDHGTAGSIAMQATTNGKLIQSGIAEKLGLFVASISTFISAFILAFTQNAKLSGILISIIPAILIVVMLMAGKDSVLETKTLQINAQAGTYAESALGSIRAIKAFSLESRIMHTYNTYLEKARVIGDKKSPLYGVMFGWQYFIIYAGMGLAFWQGIAMIARGEVDGIGTVFTVLFSVIIASTSINGIAPHLMAFSRAATSASELFALIDRKSKIDPFDESGQIPSNVSGFIDIQGLTFSYPTRPDTTVLENYSLHIPAGKVTALVGASGSGKSTIIGLLERWYDPASGAITLDGTNIRDLSLGWLRTTMRLVQQEPVLFNGTVFENIVNGLVGTAWESASKEEQLQRVKQAAKIAFADDFIANLPEGYDTRIGERGGLLSGGQKQRIAIARSVISEPKILLLDEATSALDPHAEGIVQQALDSASKDRTTVVIAHKLATIRNADNIVVMSKGKIVEQGKHDELVALNGSYAKLVKAQNLSVERKDSVDHTSEDDSTVAAEPAQSLAKYDTAVAQHLMSLKDKEDFKLYKQTGLLHTVGKLMQSTPELKVWYCVTFVTCVLGAAIYPGQTLLLSKVMDIFTSSDMVKQGNFVALMYFVMSLGTLIVYFVMGWTTNIITQTLSRKVRQGLLNGMLRQDLRFFDRAENTVGALNSRIDSHAQAVLELMGFNVSLAFLSFINVVASSVLAIAISWKLGLVGVFAGMPPLLLSGFARIRIETRMDSDVDKRFSTSASLASETVNAIRTVSSLAIEKNVLQRYTNELDNAISSSTYPVFNMMIWFALTQSIEFFILALGFWWGSKLVSNGEINFSQFIISFMGVFFSGQAAGVIFSFSSSFTKANSAANYFFWLLGLQPTIQETGENQEKGPPGGCSSIGFDDVQFSYPLAPDNRVLKGVSLTIDRGQFVAFVGASGCGKSTMISLLERFYDPTSGTIKIDGAAPLTSISPRLYRSRLALVQQEPTLFPGSIRDNIASGIDVEPEEQGSVDDRVIEEACRAANAWDFVSSLPEGLNTPCGQGGSQLSGGQRQRIAIARALVRNPSVILLDEATSALDTESEKIVQKALMEAAVTGDRITIAVAHRLSTIRDADRICVFYGGRIVEAGTHDELIEQGGMYKKMCEAQSLDRAT
ncbi:multidrug resistance protein 3 (p glycoprotein 3) [Colletotrichum karsti]|uniref:Multidrug resistance protein 3 (P glycoprotein 3) n=1 Tax=Colletotrichum karsti TaxID=1095194 RepID=A0A9P6I9V3_9PEZI|nr:multidrug resistance protein 3 (p glycoprotein 3) [Colletotrichum karsti]KAF9879522.1 multidrug resistance protein 3 (p glycoprotein 3) [Colletotrichum karsti]